MTDTMRRVLLYQKAALARSEKQKIQRTMLSYLTNKRKKDPK